MSGTGTAWPREPSEGGCSPFLRLASRCSRKKWSLPRPLAACSNVKTKSTSISRDAFGLSEKA
eukprot:scaffold3847_cov175-Prasinococcus_capsulatus_cf.AAC.2